MILSDSTVIKFKWLISSSLHTPSVCPVVLLKFQLEPLNVSVLQGSDAQFRAIMEGEWKEMTWFLNRTLVLVVSANGKETKYMDQFSAEFCSMGNNSCVEFTIHNASRHNTGPVTCAVLGVAGAKTAYLYVQGKVFNIYQTLLMYV